MTGKEFVKYIKSGDISEKAAAEIIEGMNFEADRLILELSKRAKGKPVGDEKKECVFDHACLQEDESVERFIFENVTFQDKQGYIRAMNECGAMIGMLNEPPMKMILVRQKAPHECQG